MRPITFDDAREAMMWEGVERELLRITHSLKEEQRQLRAAEHDRWERCWRTRLSRALCSLAANIEVPEPPREEESESRHEPRTLASN